MFMIVIACKIKIHNIIKFIIMMKRNQRNKIVFAAIKIQYNLRLYLYILCTNISK